MGCKFEIHKGKKDKYRFHFLKGNDVLAISSDRYASWDECKWVVDEIVKNAGSAELPEKE